MKTRQFICAAIMGTLLSTGAVMAQPRMKGDVTSSPSNTPNDTTATPPNVAVPSDRLPPAPNQRNMRERDHWSHADRDYNRPGVNIGEPGSRYPNSGAQ